VFLTKNDTRDRDYKFVSFENFTNSNFPKEFAAYKLQKLAYDRMLKNSRIKFDRFDNDVA